MDANTGNIVDTGPLAAGESLSRLAASLSARRRADGAARPWLDAVSAASSKLASAGMRMPDGGKIRVNITDCHPVDRMLRAARSAVAETALSSKLAAFSKIVERLAVSILPGSPAFARVQYPSPGRTDFSETMVTVSSSADTPRFLTEAGFSTAEAMEALILHETGHVLHASSHDDIASMVGRGSIPDDAVWAARLLMGAGNPSDDSPAAVAWRDLSFGWLKEGFADCFAAVMLGGRDPAAIISAAEKLHAAREADIDPRGGGLDTHDTRESLAFLCETVGCDTEPLSFNSPGDILSLCLDCSVAGFFRRAQACASGRLGEFAVAAFWSQCAAAATTIKFDKKPSPADVAAACSSACVPSAPSEAQAASLSLPQSLGFLALSAAAAHYGPPRADKSSVSKPPPYRQTSPHRASWGA